MSTTDLKRVSEFESPDEKRAKLDSSLSIENQSVACKNIMIGNANSLIENTSSPKNVQQEELDLNDYRNFRIKEENVGIKEFVSDNKGFKCEIKQRFSDFIVHEIASNGQIIVLTNQDKPTINNEKEITDKEIQELVSTEMREKLERLDESEKLSNELDILIDVNDKDKNQRTKIHKFVSRYINLESTTQTIDDKKYVKVVRSKSGNSLRKVNPNWPKDLPIYLHFSFYQENKGTTDALADLAKKLRINVKNIGYAGLKDKRAISTQQCSLFKILPSKLIEFNQKASEYKFPSLTGNYQFKDVPIFLGDSIGNQFQIVLRDVECENENDINEAIDNAKKNGFINYFGIQRFGHSEYPSHKVGLALVKKQYKEAVDLILRYRQKDIKPAPFSKLSKTFNDCLKIYKEDNNSKTAYKEFYWKSTNEGHLLKGLNLHGTDYLQALINIPRNNRSFYCHSFQSFIWNLIATYRFRTYGLKLVKGDLVIKKKDLINQTKNDSNENNESEEIKLKDKKSKLDKIKLNYIREFDDEDVILVDDNNLDDYTIFDVVLPMIGPKVQNPENLIKDEIKRILDELEISDELLNSVNDVFYLKGKYRRFIARPIDLEHEILKYKDNTIRLFETDLDKINQVKHKVEYEGTKTAVKLQFSLPSSTYATVLIRELSRQNY